MRPYPPWLKRAAQAGVTLLLLALVLRRVNLVQAVALLGQARVLPLALAVGAVFPATLALWAVRWNLLLRLLEIRIPFRHALLYSLIGNFAGLFLSDTMGGFIKVFYLREDGYPAARAFFSVFLDKTWEVAMLLVFGLAGLLAFPALLGDSWLSLALPLAGLAVVALLVKSLGPRAARGWLRVLRERFNGRVARWAGASVADLMDVAGRVPWRGWAWVLGASILVRLAHFIYSYLLALSLGISISFPAIVAIMSVVGIIVSLPLSIGGLGTREATMVAAFSLLGLPSPQALAFSFLIFLAGLAWRSIGVVGWLRRPLGLSALRFNLSAQAPEIVDGGVQ
ncbi:MAG: flippase-like domain-containing protein [Anaerolineae bacterium]|nr:flippase-like domain-containing protein [Anaerolineae bacterium]